MLTFFQTYLFFLLYMKKFHIINNNQMKQDQNQESQDFYQQLDEQEVANFNRHFKAKRTARNHKGSMEAQSLYKDALMDSIFGRFQDASKKLKHMITLSPDSPQPYHLLGTMHQQLGQFNKAAQYLFISTYLSPPNLEKWIKVGELSFEQKMYSQSAYCFGRALKIASCDPNIMVRRAQAFELAGQSKKAIITYKRLINTSSSVEYIKKYARLRFRRGEYVTCRQILQNIHDFKLNPNLIYMACQSYLKENKYQQAIDLLESHLIQRQKQLAESQQLPTQFIMILLICSTCLNRDCYEFSSKQLLQTAKTVYENKHSELYAQSIQHIIRFNPIYAFELVNFLLQYPQHQSISNYIIATDYLCKNKIKDQCYKLLERASIAYPHAPQIISQQIFINKCFGVNKPIHHQNQDIYYEDQDDYLNSMEDKYEMVQVENDSQTIVKILTNIRQSQKMMLNALNQDFKSDQGDEGPSNKYSYEEVLNNINFFISLSPNSKDKSIPYQQEGLYQHRHNKRKSDGISRDHPIYSNITIVLEYFQDLIKYMNHLLKGKQYRKLVQIGEKVSKVHVFKNQNKRHEFILIKLKIYQLSVLGCLVTKRFNSALFFMRFLVIKNPSNQFYLLILHLLLRFCKKKTFLSSALSKRIDNVDGFNLARLLAIQYMDTGCFQLAINSFLKLKSNQNGQLSATQKLCLSICLLQIASSRNTYNKLDFTNRSALCFAQYEQENGVNCETIYNKGRWYSQIKLNHKAIDCFKRVLQMDCFKQLKQKAAYNLLIIYKECQQFEQCQKLSKKYFNLKQQMRQQK